MTSSILHRNNASFELKSGMRKSLFPNVPPYIRFTMGGELRPLPRNIRRLLRWKYTKITPLVVRSVVRRSGFLLLEECKCWSGMWGNQIKRTAYKNFHDHQKFNHFPGTCRIGRKDDLWRNIQQMRNKHGGKNFDIMPTTYILPQDKHLFRIKCGKMKANQCWIVKPPACYRGDGIKIVQKYRQIPKKAPMIVQKYVHNPYLINGNKFDLRIYALLTSIHPLRLYLYEEGLARFASNKYNPEMNTLSDRFMHLTNYSVNRYNEQYETNSDTEACKGHKWTLKTLWKYLQNEHQVNVDDIWKSLVDLVIRTFISSEDALFDASQGNLRSKYNSYELFGLDVLLDSNLKPWLLEVNVSPSLQSTSRLDKAVKARLIQDTFNIVGFHIPASKNLSNEKLISELLEDNDSLDVISYDNRLYSQTLTSAEKSKQIQFENKINRSDYLVKILLDLTSDDVRNLILYEDESQETGWFQKIFPTHETFKYLKYFVHPRYYNFLLDAWENKYHNDREKGWEILRKLCKEGVHLRVPRKSETIKLVY